MEYYLKVPPTRWPQEKKKIRYILISLNFFIFLLLLGLGWWMTRSVPKYVPPEHILSPYQLPKNFSRTDVLLAMEHMKDANEFGFYFHALKTKDVRRVVDEAWAVLDANRDQESLHQEIERLYSRVKSLALVFAYLDIPEDFAQHRDRHPEINRMMYQLLNEEFRLAVLGLCYKATYQNSFQFEWDLSAYTASTQIRNIFLRR